MTRDTEAALRSAFRSADAGLTGTPPELESTIRQARRERTLRRLGAGGLAAVLVVVAVAAASSLRPGPRVVRPIAPTPAVATGACAGPYTSTDPDGHPAITYDSVFRFVEDFMQARVSGSGAEDCLSEEALRQYRTESAPDYDPEASGGDAGPLCLYACGRWRVVLFSIADGSILASDANSFEVAVTIYLEGPDGTRVRDADFLFVGPGRSAAGADRQFVVRGAGSDL